MISNLLSWIYRIAKAYMRFSLKTASTVARCLPDFMPTTYAVMMSKTNSSVPSNP